MTVLDLSMVPVDWLVDDWMVSVIQESGALYIGSSFLHVQLSPWSHRISLQRHFCTMIQSMDQVVSCALWSIDIRKRPESRNGSRPPKREATLLGPLGSRVTSHFRQLNGLQEIDDSSV